MEEQWYADRCRLREVLRAHPDWSKRQVAEHLGRSLGWVKKWRWRLRNGPAGDDGVLHSRSRARRHPPPQIGDAVVERIPASSAASATSNRPAWRSGSARDPLVVAVVTRSSPR